MQEDFKVFLQALWHQLDLPSPTRAQYAIADYLQHGPKRLQIQAFRGVGKSWITGAFVLWTLFNDPERKIMIISASKERADNMSIFLQKLIIETPWLSHLRPKSDEARWSRISFDVQCSPHQAPSVKSVGITGQLTGSRADLMVLDDIEVPGNSMTELMREKLLQLCTEAESILTPKPDSRILFLGTPQTTFTVYRKLAERNYRPFVWPARYPRNHTQYEGLLAPQLVEDVDTGAKDWDPTDQRFTEDDLIKDAPTVGLPGDYFYSPMHFGGGEWTPYTERICSVDPSGRGTDETTAAYISQHNGFLYLHEMRAYRDGYSDNTLLDILRGCRKFGVTKLVIETNFGDGIVSELFRKHLKQTKQSIDIEEVRANVRKEDRIIDSLEPVLNQHRLVVDRSVIDWDYTSNQDQPPEERLMYMLFYQMSRMCREKGAIKHDDRLDALAQGVKYYTDCLAISAQEAINERKRNEWGEMIMDFLDNPQKSADHLVLGMTREQIQASKTLKKTDNKSPVPTWV